MHYRPVVTVSRPHDDRVSAQAAHKPPPRLPSVHESLREATREVHERLHRHAGFAAVLGGTIAMPAYRALLFRLLGFHMSFERTARIACVRSVWLKRDLQALGVEPKALDEVLLCPIFPAMDTPAQRAGALYVIEGSALGGQHLARRLDGLLGPGAIDGRRYFTGRGTRTGAAWRALLADLETWGDDGPAREAVVATAVTTFLAFEEWLAGWGGDHVRA